MTQPDKLKVRAIIPSTPVENEDKEFEVRHITDAHGLYPEVEIDQLSASTEHILHEIGRLVAGVAVSVDRTIRGNYQIPHTEDVINIANVHAKPVNPATAKLAEGYGWKKV